MHRSITMGETNELARSLSRSSGVPFASAKERLLRTFARGSRGRRVCARYLNKLNVQMILRDEDLGHLWVRRDHLDRLLCSRHAAGRSTSNLVLSIKLPLTEAPAGWVVSELNRPMMAD